MNLDWNLLCNCHFQASPSNASAQDITVQKSQLNSHEKLIQNAYNYVLILKITKTNCYDHQTDITVEFTLQNSTECILSLKITKTRWFNHQTNITVEFALKNDTECIYILLNCQNCQNRLVQSLNRYYNWIYIEKWCRMNIHICYFSKLPKQVGAISE